MDALASGGVLTTVQEVGVTIFIVVASAYFVVLLIKLLTGVVKSSDNRWDDLIEIQKDQLQVQRGYSKELADLNLNMQTGFSQVRTEFDEKIDVLESKLDEVAAEVKRLVVMIGEDNANG